MQLIYIIICFMVSLAGCQTVGERYSAVESIAPSFGTPQYQLLGGNPTRAAGYIPLAGTASAKMFYMYFQNRGGYDNAPVAIWLNGGPACSSLYGLFYLKMGPYNLDEDSLAWYENEFGWDRSLSMVFVDQPINTGFSYSTDSDDWVDTQERLAEDMLQFVLGFLKRYPELQKRDLYITGESYAGSMIPVIASRIVAYNQDTPEAPINLAGIAMGNGMTAPHIQYLSYKDYALMEGLIDEPIYQQIHSVEPRCLEMTSQCQTTMDKTACCEAYYFCIYKTFGLVIDKNPDLNYYDIREQGGYDVSSMIELLNLERVRIELGIPDEVSTYEIVNFEVQSALSHDMMRSEDKTVAGILAAGVRVLVYAGDRDLKCNWLGNQWWLDALEWGGKSDWAQAPQQTWGPADSPWGVGKEAHGLTFLKIFDAGHAVALNQPYRSLAFIHAFTRNRSIFEKAAMEFPGKEQTMQGVYMVS